MVTPTGEVKRVADIVVGRILDGSYPFGLRLPAESALADELACGRSTVREALRYLADLGLVRSRRGSGAMVLDYRREGMPALLPAYLMRGKLESPPANVARELLRIRSMMASEAVRLAARYASRESLAEARQVLKAAPALEGDPAAHALNELDLYRALIVASGIAPATWMVNAFWTPLRELNAAFAPAQGQVRDDFQPAMTELLNKIEAGDEDGAMDHVRRWFEQVDATLMKVIESALSMRGV
jgi:DNA-binding FadR family transcriptional regulator